MVISFAVSIVMGGYTGAVRYILSFHEDTVNAATENVMGLLTLTTTVLVFAVTFAIIFIRAAILKLHKS